MLFRSPVSNTPQQALTLLNDPTFVEAARVFAQSLLAKPSASPAARLNAALLRALGRPGTPAEQASLLGFLAVQLEEFRRNPSRADELLRTGLAPRPADADPAELAAWTCTCRVILNLHETITRF